jgi:hypothetical protein
VLANLEYLEITLSRSPVDHFDGDRPLFEPHSLSSASAPIPAPSDYLTYRSDYELSKIREFRFMSVHQYTFAERDLFLTLTFFPNLEKLAFGHITLGGGDWSGLLQ